MSTCVRVPEEGNPGCTELCRPFGEGSTTPPLRKRGAASSGDGYSAQPSVDPTSPPGPKRVRTEGVFSPWRFPLDNLQVTTHAVESHGNESCTFEELNSSIQLLCHQFLQECPASEQATRTPLLRPASSSSFLLGNSQCAAPIHDPNEQGDTDEEEEEENGQLWRLFPYCTEHSIHRRPYEDLYEFFQRCLF
ncbi:hypothetical protein QOT17_002649 [Balamuthia mandrillaris]